MRVVVLGAGLIGGPMAIDLARDDEFDVTVVDLNPTALDKLSGGHPAIRTVQQDLSDSAVIRSVVAEQDIVLNAVPGFMGFQT